MKKNVKSLKKEIKNLSKKQKGLRKENDELKRAAIALNSGSDESEKNATLLERNSELANLLAERDSELQQMELSYENENSRAVKLEANCRELEGKLIVKKELENEIDELTKWKSGECEGKSLDQLRLMKREFEEGLSKVKKAIQEKKKMERECVVCMDALKTHVFNCGHMVCEECGKKLTNCPECRAPVTNMIKVYGYS